MKRLIAILLCLVMAVSLLAGCGAVEEADSDGFSVTGRFETVWSDYDDEIIVDTKTGVMYFYYDGYNAGGLTVMVDAEGNPLIWDDYK